MMHSVDTDQLQDAISRARKATGEVISYNAALSELVDTNYRAHLDRLMAALDDAARLADPKWYPPQS